MDKELRIILEKCDNKAATKRAEDYPKVTLKSEPTDEQIGDELIHVIEPSFIKEEPEDFSTFPESVENQSFIKEEPEDFFTYPESVDNQSVRLQISNVISGNDAYGMWDKGESGCSYDDISQLIKSEDICQHTEDEFGRDQDLPTVVWETAPGAKLMLNCPTSAVDKLIENPGLKHVKHVSGAFKHAKGQAKQNFKLKPSNHARAQAKKGLKVKASMKHAKAQVMQGLKSSHGGARKKQMLIYLCDFCKMAFSYLTERQLNKHKTACACKSCGKVFQCVGNLINYDLHKDPKSCMKTFDKKVQHKFLEGYPFVCSECNISFLGMAYLKKHRSSHFNKNKTQGVKMSSRSGKQNVSCTKTKNTKNHSKAEKYSPKGEKVVGTTKEKSVLGPRVRKVANTSNEQGIMCYQSHSENLPANPIQVPNSESLGFTKEQIEYQNSDPIKVCKSCSKEFKNLGEYYTHCQTDSCWHFICRSCGDTFVRRNISEFISHYKSVRCNYCRKEFSCDSFYKEHCKDHTCQTCQKLICTESLKEEHAFKCNSEYYMLNYNKCSKCNLRFTGNPEERLKEYLHHSKVKHCVHCTETFGCYGLLRNHDMEGKLCQECPKMFFSCEAFLKHTRCNVCRFCGNNFKCVTHCEPKSCYACGKHFFCNTLLKNHTAKCGGSQTETSCFKVTVLK